MTDDRIVPPKDPGTPTHFLRSYELPLSSCCDAAEIDEFPGFCGHCHDHADFYVTGSDGEVTSSD